MTDTAEETSSLIRALTHESETGDRWIDLSSDPDAAERLGRALAERAARHEPQLTVTWAVPDDVVLAHIVSRELGIPALRADLDLGLITLDRDIDPAQRVLLLTATDGEYRRLESLGTLLRGQGHRIAAAASVLGSAAPLLTTADTPQFSLA
jgi:hypothetical protein